MVKINFDRRSIQSQPVYTDPTEILMEFTRVLEHTGLRLTGLPDTSGKINRVPTTDDRGRAKSGWYVAFDGEVFGAAYGNFKTGEEGKWSSVDRMSMSSAQIAEHQRQIQVAKAEREIAQNEIYREAAKEAEGIMSRTEISTYHKYADTKNINGEYLVYNKAIIIPAYDEDGEISTVQFINYDGTKKFLPGGRKKGCFHLINGETDTVYICEGWATGQTINEATGKTVVVAFDSGNLYPVAENVRAKFPNSSLVVAGDDDHENSKANVGRAKAESCAQSLGLMCVFPDVKTGETDFNDVGVERTKDAIKYRPEIYEHSQPNKDVPLNLLNPEGILADIVNYYNSTARAPQHGFAVQVSLAIASLICGRRFKTTKGNFTSMYFLNVAKSSTGKEHIKTVCEEVLEACGKEDLLNGSGYTSAGAVFSTLLRRPRHLTIIDEFGRYLEAAGNRGNSNFQEANTQLMEAIGRCHGTMRPLAYSTMAVSSEKADEMANRKIRNPAITLVSMTTPSTLFANISSNNVSDGFLGRFIVSISDMPRAVHEDRDWVEVPKRIVDWAEQIDARFGAFAQSELSEQSPSFIELSFDHKSLQMLKEFDQERVDMSNDLEAYGLEALAGRTKEMAMRMALVVALAKDPNANTVDADSTSWAIQYVRHSLQSTVKVMKRNISDSVYESNCKRVLDVIRSAGEKGINKGPLLKRAPLKSLEPKDREIILGDLFDNGFVRCEDKPSGRRGGRPTSVYFSIKTDD